VLRGMPHSAVMCRSICAIHNQGSRIEWLRWMSESHTLTKQLIMVPAITDLVIPWSSLKPSVGIHGLGLAHTSSRRVRVRDLSPICRVYIERQCAARRRHPTSCGNRSTGAHD